MTDLRPAHCGLCDPATRMVETADDRAAHCPRCSPRAPGSLTALLERRARLQLEIDGIDRAIAAAEAAADTSVWARGPGGRQ